MATISCSKCGADVLDTSKFCRSCGKAFDPGELTTRKLEPDVEVHAPTNPVYQSPTSPAYVQPSPLPVIPATNDLNQGSSNRKVIIVLAAAVGVLLFMLIAVLIVKFNSGSPNGRDAVISVPAAPPPPGAPAPPPPPRLGDVVNETLVYPGSERVMTISGAEGKGVLQLRTEDSADEVIAWYIEKLKPTERVNLAGGNAVLRSGDTAVIISSGDEGTSIMITRGDDDTR